MIRWESGGEQFTSAGLPDISSTQDVGIVQINQPTHPGYFENANASPNWNFVVNIQDARAILTSDEGLGTICTASGGKGCAAYSFWDRQVKQMCMDEQGAQFTAGGQTGDGSCSRVVPLTTVSWPYCTFSLSAGQPSNFKDAELIKDYNGAAQNFIAWGSGSWDAPNDAPNNYVENVCSSAPY